MHYSSIPIALSTLSVILPGVYGAALRRDSASALVCYEDNTLRGLERFSTDAAGFCPAYLAGQSGNSLPSYLSGVDATKISSACKCFEKTASPLSSTTAASTTETTTSKTSAPMASTTSSSTTYNPAPTTSSAGSSTTTSTSVVSTSASSSTTTTSRSGSGSSTKKRGLVYDANSKTSYGQMFAGSPYISFGSNWQDKRVIGGATLDNSFGFVPTLNVGATLENADWNTTVTDLIKNSGVKTLFASNEPDNAAQANLSPADAAKVYKRYMQHFSGQAKLATPAVTNGGGATGLNYLGDFLNACTDCTFDLINVHHYLQRTDVNVAQGVSALKSYLTNDVPTFQAAHPQVKDAKIVLGEFWLWGASLDEGGTYLQSMLPWLDANPAIDSYQAFGGLWTGNFVTADGTGLTPAGTAYKSYSA